MGLPATSAPLMNTLIVREGADKGAAYQLVSRKITLGRAEDNHIVIRQDNKVSRHHAVIEIDNGRVTARDVSEKNVIYINGHPCKDGVLAPGALLKIGHTVFEFQVPEPLPMAATSAPMGGALSLQHSSPPSPLRQESFVRPSPPPPLYAVTSDPPSGRLRFYLIAALILGVLFYFIKSQQNKSANELEIRTSEEIFQDTADSQKRQEAIKQTRTQEGKSNEDYHEAQGSYLRCFRDYQQGQYLRAIQHCQAALALSSQHVLADRYLGLARRKHDEQIQYLLKQGRRYHESGHYKYCMSNLRTVMFELKDPSHSAFKEAKELYSECQLLSQGKY